MKQGSIFVIICALFLLAPNIQAEDKIIIKLPFAFQDRFQEGSQQLGFPEGNVLQVGCIIKPAGSPIKEVTARNIASGLILTASPKNVGNIWSGLYMVDPMPAFNPTKHMGVWEIRVNDETGNEAMAETHRLNNYGQMPYIDGLTASGNPLAPLLSWSAPNENEIPKNCSIKYQVRLLIGMGNQFHKSEHIIDTKYQIPENLIKSEDLSKIYIRVDTMGYDKTDSEHSLPLEVSSGSFMLLQEALSKK